jgi:hypothetical protein
MSFPMMIVGRLSLSPNRTARAEQARSQMRHCEIRNDLAKEAKQLRNAAIRASFSFDLGFIKHSNLLFPKRLGFSLGVTLR